LVTKLITSSEKKCVKKKDEQIDKDLDNKVITKEQADDLKLKKAAVHAANIDSKVVQEEKLKLSKIKWMESVITRSGGNRLTQDGPKSTPYFLLYNGQEVMMNAASTVTICFSQ
jgi:hypothetical protein